MSSKILALYVNAQGNMQIASIFKSEYLSAEALALDVNYGITSGTWDAEGKVMANDSDPVVLNVSPSDYAGVKLIGGKYTLLLNGVEVTAVNQYDIFYDFGTNMSYRCYMGMIPLQVSTLPVIPMDVAQSFLETLRGKVEEYFINQTNHMGTDNHHYQLTVVPEVLRGTQIWSLKLDGKLYQKDANGVSSYMTIPEDDFIELHIEIKSTKIRTFISIPSIHLPLSTRGKGIYTGIVEQIAEFMKLHSLGTEIELVDRSDDEASSRIPEKFGLSCDPFMESRYW
jgi:hypothetical protein